jgi:hypothetical protein
MSIPRSTGRCAEEDRPLDPGEPVVVVLLEREDSEDLDRLDYSVGAWESGARPGGAVFAWWRAEAPIPGRRPGGLVSADGLLDLFEQLGETDDPRRLAFRYVLALHLVRTRRLEFAGAQAGLMLVRPRGSDPTEHPIAVADPIARGELDEAATQELLVEVAALLDRGDEG